jgi:hypothetical protein
MELRLNRRVIAPFLPIPCQKTDGRDERPLDPLRSASEQLDRQFWTSTAQAIPGIAPLGATHPRTENAWEIPIWEKLRCS